MFLSALILLLMGSAVLTLRLGGDLGSFPRPLCPEEEKRYIDLWTKGDMAARNKLIEHNLRLVAHIIKKMCYKRIQFQACLKPLEFHRFSGKD